MTNPDNPPAADLSVAYWCQACPATFKHEADSIRHSDATGHAQTWRPSGSYAARRPCVHCGRPRVAAIHLPDAPRAGAHAFEAAQ